MPGSLTTRSRAASRDGEAARVAFGVRHALGAPDGITIAARWLACAHPCRRFAPVLADRDARLGADVGRYSFIAEDSHLLPPGARLDYSPGLRYTVRRWLRLVEPTCHTSRTVHANEAAWKASAPDY